MKTPCDIIRDLLPLYAEDMTSKASNEMVEEHLGECESCTDYLEELKKPAQLPEEVPFQSLTHIKKAISKRKFLTVLIAVFTVLSLLAGVFNFLRAEIVLTADQAIHHLEEMEDGTVRLHWRYKSNGWSSNKAENGPGNWGMIVSHNRSDLLTGKDLITDEDRKARPDRYFEILGEVDEIHDPKDNYWYINVSDGTAENLLRNGGAEMPADGFVINNMVNHHLALSCVLAGLLSAVFGGTAWMFRGRRAGKWLRWFALFFGCVCVSVLFSSGGQFVNHHGEFHNKFARSWLSTVPLFLTGYFSFELWDMSHPVAPRKSAPMDTKSQRRIFAVLTAVLLVFSLGMGVFSFLYVATVYMTAEEAVVSVTELENGDVKFEYAHSAGSMTVGTGDYVADLNQEHPKNLMAHRWLKKPMEPREVSSWFVEPREKVEARPSRWYLNPKDGTADVLLWDNGTPKPEGPLMKKNYGLAYYCAATALCTILFALIARVQPEVGKYLRYAAVVSGSLCIAAMCITGVEFYKFEDWYDMQYRIYNSLFTAVPFFLTGLCALKLHDLKKQNTP